MRAARQFSAYLVHQIPHLSSDRTQIVSFNAGIDIDHRCDVVVRDVGILLSGFDLHQITQNLRRNIRVG